MLSGTKLGLARPFTPKGKLGPPSIALGCSRTAGRARAMTRLYLILRALCFGMRVAFTQMFGSTVLGPTRGLL